MSMNSLTTGALNCHGFLTDKWLHLLQWIPWPLLYLVNTLWNHCNIFKIKTRGCDLHATKVEITWRRNAILWWCDIYKGIHIDAFVSEVEPTHLLMIFSNVRLLQKFIYQHWYLPSIYIYIYLHYMACTILIDL
jgi:hypothetical protein